MGGESISQLTIDGIEVESIVSVSETEIVVIVGSNAARRNRRAIGRIFILVNTGASIRSAEEVGFEYLELGAVAALSPNSGQTGTRVEITGERMLAVVTGLTRSCLAMFW